MQICYFFTLTRSSFQDALKFGSFILHRLPLKFGPKALDGEIHHVNFHQVQNSKDLPVSITTSVIFLQNDYGSH